MCDKRVSVQMWHYEITKSQHCNKEWNLNWEHIFLGVSRYKR